MRLSPNARTADARTSTGRFPTGDQLVRFCDERSNGPLSGAATISPSLIAARATNAVSADAKCTRHARPAFGERKRPDGVAATTVSSSPQAIAATSDDGRPKLDACQLCPESVA